MSTVSDSHGHPFAFTDTTWQKVCTSEFGLVVIILLLLEHSCDRFSVKFGCVVYSWYWYVARYSSAHWYIVAISPISGWILISIDISVISESSVICTSSLYFFWWIYILDFSFWNGYLSGLDKSIITKNGNAMTKKKRDDKNQEKYMLGSEFEMERNYIYCKWGILCNQISSIHVSCCGFSYFQVSVLFLVILL